MSTKNSASLFENYDNKNKNIIYADRLSMAGSQLSQISILYFTGFAAWGRILYMDFVRRLLVAFNRNYPEQ